MNRIAQRLIAAFFAIVVATSAFAGPFAGGGGSSGSSSGGRTLLTGDKTLYVRTPAHVVTFTNGSANVGWTTHGLSVNDAVVLSVVPNRGAATVTIASPGVFTKVGHGYVAGQPLRIDTTGALPTGLTAGGTVYVIAAGLTADNFEVSATAGGAAINTTGTQSGTHYVSQVGAMPTFSTAGLLVEGTVYYVKTVVSANAVTLSTTAGGTALGTATVAAGLPIYSGSTGSDSNDGSAADRAHAFLTANHAAQVASAALDLQGYQVVVQLANSVYPALTLPSTVGGNNMDVPGSYAFSKYPPASLLGDTSAPEVASNVRFVAGPSDLEAIKVTGAWRIEGVAAVVDSAQYQNITVDNGALLFAGSIDLISQGAGAAINVIGNGLLNSQPVTPTGKTNTWFVAGEYTSLIHTESGQAFVWPSAIVLLNTLTIDTAFLANYMGGFIQYEPASVTGTASGARVYLTSGSELLTTDGFGGAPAGISTIPGTSNGTVQAGAFFNGSVAGTSTNDSAIAGFAGEYTSSCLASASAITLSNGTVADVRSLALTAGDWDVEGSINFADTTATVTGGSGGINTSSATLPTDGSEVYDGTVTTALSDTSSITVPRKRVSLAASGTAYLSASKSFSAGTVKAFGCITARRPR